MKYHIVNGNLLESTQTTLHFSDLGLLRGYGIFDFFPIHNGCAVFQADYFERFFTSARRMGLDIAISSGQLADQIALLCRQNDVGSGYVRLVLTGGNSENGHTPSESNLLIIQYPEVHYDASVYTEGIRLLLQRFMRLSPSIKSLNYANAIVNRDLVAEHNAIDLLYHDGRHVYETSRSNFFIVDENEVLCTSHDTILRGITRSKVLSLASEQYDIDLGPLALTRVARAQEAFITSTTKGVMPVTKIDGLKIGNGAVGPVSKQLYSDFRDHKRLHMLDMAQQVQV